MKAAEWKTFIRKWSHEHVKKISKMREPEELRPIHTIHGFGFVGASEGQIHAVETRLEVRLPTSYREFLKATNGLLQPVEGMLTTGGDFWPVERIDWLKKRNRKLIRSWSKGDYPEIADDEYLIYGEEQDTAAIRPEYLETALEISHDGDEGIYLLNPKVEDADGEWEAWHLAAWLPGATRYSSFCEMMQGHYQDFLDNDDVEAPCGF